MSILRPIGPCGLPGTAAPVFHSAKRTRIKTAMQELIYRAERLIERGPGVTIGLDANDRAAEVVMHLNAQFAATTRRFAEAETPPSMIHTVLTCAKHAWPGRKLPRRDRIARNGRPHNPDWSKSPSKWCPRAQVHDDRSIVVI